jgi:hypothetical protein
MGQTRFHSALKRLALAISLAAALVLVAAAGARAAAAPGPPGGVVGRPTNVGPPTIAGTPAVGQTLTLNVGSWQGSGPLTFLPTWLFCDATDCAADTTASGHGLSYTIRGPIRPGLRLVAVVKASGPGGVGFATALPTAPISTTATSPAPSPATSPAPATTTTTTTNLCGAAFSFCGNWDTGDASQWDGLECANPSTQWWATTSPLRQGPYAAGFKEGPTDVWTNGSIRCLAAKYDTAETSGQEYYYGLSLYIPSPGISNNLLWELHQGASIYTQTGCVVAPYAILVKNGVLVFRIATGDCSSTGSAYWEPGIAIDNNQPYPSDTWLEFIIHITFAESWTGTVEVWYRPGSNAWPSQPQIARYNIPTLMYSSTLGLHDVPLYTEIGLYTGATSTTVTDTAYNDGYRRGSTFADILAGFPSANPVAAPAIASGPTISGTAQERQTLTATSSWTGNPTPTVAYQWQRCSSATVCTNITGATGSSYNLVRADVGSTIGVVATATNSVGSSSATSSQTSTVTGAPINTAPPTISGSAKVGQTLTANAGGWTGYPVPTYTFQWQRCNRGGNSCSAIGSATTKTTYSVTSADSGRTIRVSVKATNAVGSASATSAPTAVVG